MTSDFTATPDPEPFDPRAVVLRLARGLPVALLCGLLGAIVGAALGRLAPRMQVASIQVQLAGPSTERSDLASLAGFADAAGLASLLLSPDTSARLAGAALVSDPDLPAGAGPDAIARRWVERFSVAPEPDRRSLWIVARAAGAEAASRLAHQAMEAAGARLSARVTASAGRWLSGWERESAALVARIAEFEEVPASDRGPGGAVAIEARLERRRETERGRLVVGRFLANGDHPWVVVATQEPIAEPRRGAAVAGALGTFVRTLHLAVVFPGGLVVLPAASLPLLVLSLALSFLPVSLLVLARRTANRFGPPSAPSTRRSRSGSTDGPPRRG